MHRSNVLHQNGFRYSSTILLQNFTDPYKVNCINSTRISRHKPLSLTRSPSDSWSTCYNIRSIHALHSISTFLENSSKIWRPFSSPGFSTTRWTATADDRRSSPLWRREVLWLDLRQCVYKLAYQCTLPSPISHILLFLVPTFENLQITESIDNIVKKWQKGD